jgi:pimeloyl-ACP methyl ester carboxylesterase
MWPMPNVERPDGVTIRWDERGQGPVVLLVHHVWSHPRSYEELIADLATDHRVVTYDPRGCGQSTRRGPYDPGTDADDLEAVLERCGGAAVAIGVMAGFNRAARVGARRPQLVDRVVAVGPAAAAVLPRSELEGSDGLFASESVAGMLIQLMRTDPRAALRTIVTAANPEFDDDELRERVDLVYAYCRPEAMQERVLAWLSDDIREQARALGDRLHVLHGSESLVLEDALASRVTELFPQARVEEAPGGPISRPDLTAAVVRRMTS